MSRCPKADALRIAWYLSRRELDKWLLENHLSVCPVCREIMLDLTAQARQAEMPELESEE